MDLRITVHGDPAPQGSKRAFRNKYTGTIQQTESSTRLRPWRADVREAVEAAVPPGHPVVDGPVCVTISFGFARPKSHYRTGRNAHLLRDDVPMHPTGRVNDLDKLARAVLDAIGSTGLVWRDDGQVVGLGLRKAYFDQLLPLTRPGAVIHIWERGVAASCVTTSATSSPKSTPHR